ncbi:hypothetical protein CAPTEDRAFT_183144 [Capitella teleta]|uniref:Hsp90 chaperone protein kinase-targeting subunit n=1 Tax=Capitella teleta TaxID=283909 RepID=R7TYV9_CAPTE|nr:hypothetical protein CAPTEDRAFT_183144 [Capitella teleta]|eukprot:ELT99118.1 hypothetical protein CAPTEDRAFT_183144 [Capitella teleta]
MAKKGIDYSKWDHIEISDDEDDTHPNVDTPSLFKWRHEARVERMAQTQKEKDQIMKQKADKQQKLTEIKNKLKEVETASAADELAKLKLEEEKLSKEELEWRKKEEELLQKEKLQPWNVDTICKEGKSKTIINKNSSRKDENLSEDEKWERQQQFTDKNERLMKKFGMLRKYEDSQAFLTENPFLTCEETANYLVIWCVNLEVEEKHDLMLHVSHQTIVMQFILELARSLDMDPKSCVAAFFSRIKMAEQQYMEAFNDELNAFRQRIKARAAARLEDAMRQAEEEEKKERLGPGGLDPVEVFETLPKVLQDCFESKDVSLLQKAIAEMPKEEAAYHMKRCVDSGLWVPNAADQADQQPEEEVYASPNDLD